MPTQPVLPSPRFPKALILELVRTLAEVQCVWTTARRNLQGLRPGTEMAWMICGLQSYVEVGTDELRVAYDPTADRNVESLRGQRNFTLVLRAQSLDARLEAFDLCERVRFRMRTTTARAIMVPILALRDFGPTTTLPDSTYDVGGTQRALLEATLDVRMACVVAADPGDPGNYIATVDPSASSMVIGPATGNGGGNLLP
jgi:hypothetical protein